MSDSGSEVYELTGKLMTGIPAEIAVSVSSKMEKLEVEGAIRGLDDQALEEANNYFNVDPGQRGIMDPVSVRRYFDIQKAVADELETRITSKYL